MKKLLHFIILTLLWAFLFCACDQSAKECDHETLSSETVAPTCDSEGYTRWQCADCALQYDTGILPPKGHTLTKEITSPSCGTEGYTLYQCTDCEFGYRSDTVAPTGHTLSTIVTAPTCTEAGFTRYACACGYSYNSDEKAPTGHNYRSDVVSPTCTEAGYTLLTCKVCTDDLRTDIQEPLGHAEVKSTIPPTCTKAGYTEHSCQRCPYVYRAEYLSPLGHTFSSSIIHPTRTSAGAFVRTCLCQYEIMEPLLYGDIFGGAFVENDAPLAKGVDVSLYQHAQKENSYLPLDWTTVKNAGFEFAILKVGSTPRLSENGETLGGIDPVFEMNYLDAKAAGIQLGAYFYTYAVTPEEARADALRVASWLRGKQFEYPIYFDLEDTTQESLGKDTLTSICGAFISTLQENGFYAALYTNNDWLVNRLHADIIKPLYDIWYARPPMAGTAPVDSDEVFLWNTEKYGANLGMWQYTHHGVIDGIENVEFDFNYVYRDYPSIIKKYGYNGFAIE